jgi:hypothetical protein
VVIDKAGNVGIGTTAPGTTLDVSGTIRGTAIKVGANSVTTGTGTTNYLSKWSAANALTDSVVYEVNGNIGIGATAPVHKLEVGGNIKLTGRILQGSLGDLAEMMPVSCAIHNPANVPHEDPQILEKGRGEKPREVIVKDKEEYRKYLLSRPEAGDVVVIDEDGGVRRSYKPYSTNTVGIISTNPAQILRDGLENAVPVALSGIVPCKVTSENGPVKPGDLLVSSSTPGHAMAAGPNPAAGAVIGKALTRLEGDTGVVDALVMMK